MKSTQAGSERVKPPNSSSFTSPVSVVSSFWKEFDLEKEKNALDEQGLRIAEHQENSQKNRRKLVQSTRDFKKASAEDKLNLFNSLLKSYQEEVDNLTKRAKFGENVFLNIYQKLYEAPDPYPAIASISEQDLKLFELESENRKIKVELEEFRTEATHLKNQHTTIRRLEERNRQLEQQMLEKIKEIVEIKQHSLVQENQKALDAIKERERLLQDKLRREQESVSNMKKLHARAQSQLFELCAQSDEERAAKQAEVTLLMDEVERAQTRFLSLEWEKGLLRSQLQLANDDTGNKKSDNLDLSNILENSLSAKEKVILELNMELHKTETILSSEREQHVIEIKNLNALINQKEAAIDEMKRELQARPTEKMVDDLRKKVKILQAVGYNSIEAEDWEVSISGEEMSKIESLLLDNNRKMGHELTQYKVKLSEKSSLLDTAESKIAELTAKVVERQKLIQKLEDDIFKGYNSKDQKGSLFDDWDLSEARGGLSENVDGKRFPLDQDQSSMLKVICSQRDRFRARLQEAEEEIRHLKEKIGQLTVELDKTKADNVKLYGKICNVQEYNLEKVVSRGSKKHAEDLESDSKSDDEFKHKKIYEDDINQFAAFSRKERDQRHKELGFRDRITLSGGRFLPGNKMASSSKLKEKHHWTNEDEQMLVDALCSLVGGMYHTRTGNFRKNYSLQVLNYFKARRPDLNIEKYSIECKTKTFKRHYMAIKEMKGPAGNGFGWNEAKQCVDMERETFDNWVSSHPNAKGLWNKTFPFMDQLSIVFNSDVDGQSLATHEAAHLAVNERTTPEARLDDDNELGSENYVDGSNIGDDMFATPLAIARPNSSMRNNKSSGTKRKKVEHRNNMDDILHRATDDRRATMEQLLALQRDHAYSLERKQMEVRQRVEELVGFTENQKRLICEEVCHDTLKLNYFVNMKSEWVESYCNNLILAITTRSPGSTSI